MSDSYDPIDSLVSNLKSNAGFLDRLLFPRLALVLGVVGILVAIIFFIKVETPLPSYHPVQYRDSSPRRSRQFCSTSL